MRDHIFWILTAILLTGSNLSTNEAFCHQIAAGGTQSLMICVDGTVWAVGGNAYGQLGDQTGSNSTSSVQVFNLTNCIGVAAGWHHSVGLKSDGTVWTWGRNNYGQLGDNTTTNRFAPVQVTGITNVIEVAAGQFHTIALKSDGTVWCWGLNDAGQLGDSTQINRTVPVQVLGLAGVTSITGGTRYTKALRSDSTVWGWGSNGGVLGDGTTTQRFYPVLTQNLTGVIAIEAGWIYSMALKSDGTVWSMGNNNNGELGDGTTTNSLVPTQVLVSDIVAIGGGYVHALAVKDDGTVWTWGRNPYGQLGRSTGAWDEFPAPANVIATGVNAAAYYHSMVLQDDSIAMAMGRNVDGQLGNGNTSNTQTPAPISLGCKIPAYSTIPLFSATIASSTNVVCSGDCDGSATVATSNGVGPFTYIWDDPMNQITQTATGLCAGTYNVVAMDNNGDTVNAGVMIGEPSPLLSTSSATDAICLGSNDGSGMVSVTGGTPPYSYAWNTVPVQTMATATNLGIGYSSVTVLDASSCMVTDSVMINEPALITGTGSAEICSGDSILLAGSFQNIAGVYPDTLASALGCDSVVSTTLTVNSLPSVSFTGLDQTYCMEGLPYTVALIPSPSGGIFTGPGMTDSIFNPFASAIGTFSITYAYTDGNGCLGSESQEVTVVSVCTGIEERSLFNNLKIHPNPSAGEFIISMNFAKEESFELRLFNNLGQQIMSEHITKFKGSFEKPVNLSGYAEGVYNFQLLTDWGVSTRQVIIE